MVNILAVRTAFLRLHIMGGEVKAPGISGTFFWNSHIYTTKCPISYTRRHMKKNTFYLLIGCIAIALVCTFWYSDEIHSPLLIMGAFITAVVLIFYARSRVTDLIQDERDIKITELAMTRTMQVFWVVFCTFSIGAVAQMLQVPSFPRSIPGQRTMTLLSPRLMGFVQLGFLCLMIFLYVAFRIYYARKYGEWDTDEE